MSPYLIKEFLALAVFFATVNATINMADVACGRAVMRTSRVKGGQDAKFGEFPWMVSIRINGGHFCGGLLINNKFVLSAAHCTLRRPEKYVTVVVGEYDLLKEEKTPPEQIIAVHKIYNHENFTKRYIDDISLLELKEPVVWSKNIRPMCLPDMMMDGTDNPLDNTAATLAGWGWTDEHSKGGVRANILQKTDVRVVSKDSCQESYVKETGKAVGEPQAIVLFDTHLCAGVPDGSRDACQGDSGGPLMSRDKEGREVCVGIVSAGIGCGRPGLPGLYTRVSRYTNWIQATVNAANA